MLDNNELLKMQETVGATDEEIAARAKMSKTTLRRAIRGDAPTGTQTSVREALEAIRVERIKTLTNLKCKSAG